MLMPLMCGAGATKGLKTTSGRSISIQMVLSGDLNQAYQFDGLLGDLIPGVPAASVSASQTSSASVQCDAQALFRLVIVSGQKKIETWIDLKCLSDGQKTEYKLPRLFIDSKASEKKQILAPLSAKLKKLALQVTELNLKLKSKD